MVNVQELRRMSITVEYESVKVRGVAADLAAIRGAGLSLDNLFEMAAREVAEQVRREGLIGSRVVREVIPPVPARGDGPVTREPTDYVKDGENLTAEEVAAKTGFSPVTIYQHLRELTKAGLIIKSSERPARYRLAEKDSPDMLAMFPAGTKTEVFR